MKTPRVLFVVLFAFCSSGFAQEAPIVLAQAGGSARGAGTSAGTTGVGTTITAVVAALVAATAAAGTGNSTVTTASHH